MDLQLNADRFTGKEYTTLYDAHRPSPPDSLLIQGIHYVGGKSPSLVVDLGCGSGISTLAWKKKAQQIIGIEPSEDMIQIARNKLASHSGKVRLIQGFAHEVPLENGVTDIVCCSQAFHWMDPAPTLKEVNRILRPGGVFMIYDCTWPPSYHWELEKAYTNLFKTITALTQTLDKPIAHHWEKSGHKTNIEKSRYFRYIKEARYHKTVEGDLERFLGLALSQGSLQALINLGYSEEEVGLKRFRNTIADFKGKISSPITFHYKAIFAIK